MTIHSCWAEIDTQALEDNYRLLRSLAPGAAECVAVVKADAYGHSLALCGPAAVRAGARWLAVATMPEAIAARSASAEARILAIGGVLPGWGAEAIAHGITPSVWTLAQMEELEGAARAADLGSGAFPVHLEIDTGMSRQGVSLDELPATLARFGSQSPLRVEAVMTHLYASDESDGARSRMQLERLEKALGIVRSVPEAAPRLAYLSAGASAALSGRDAEAVAVLAAKFQLQPMFRFGLALYGIAPLSADWQLPGRLVPVLTWKTRVESLREISPGAEIGYNGTFVATEPMRLALISAGYADGLDRRLGNRFSLLVHDERAPIVGRVSMDTAVLDVTGIAGVEAGDEVVILGAQGAGTIPAWELAEAAGTIPWEVFTRIGPRVPRVRV